VKPGISLSWDEESPEAKARWFQSLTVEERMELFAEFTDFLLEINPAIKDAKDAEPVAGRVLVLRKPPG